MCLFCHLRFKEVVETTTPFLPSCPVFILVSSSFMPFLRSSLFLPFLHYSCPFIIIIALPSLSFLHDCQFILLVLPSFLSFLPSCPSFILALSSFLPFLPSCPSFLLAIHFPYHLSGLFSYPAKPFFLFSVIFHNNNPVLLDSHYLFLPAVTGQP